MKNVTVAREVETFHTKFGLQTLGDKEQDESVALMRVMLPCAQMEVTPAPIKQPLYWLLLDHTWKERSNICWTVIPLICLRLAGITMSVGSEPDLVQVNYVMKPDAVPLSRMGECIDQVRSAS